MPNLNDEFNTAKRIAAYENATSLLAQRVSEIKMPAGFRAEYNMTDMVYRFRNALKNPDVRKSLLLSKYEAERLRNARFSAGFCGITSYAWNHIFRMPDGREIWQMKQTSGLGKSIGLPDHVWLEQITSGEVLDLTFDQFIDKSGTVMDFPYELGTPVSANIVFNRGYIFGRHIGIDIEGISIINALREQRE